MMDGGASIYLVLYENYKNTFLSNYPSLHSH